ncbi:MAG: peptide deformylase, partial [Gammaproteobacteria bacterium]
MVARVVLKMGDPRLLETAKPVMAFATPELDDLVDDLMDTMLAEDGAGLAAPQIGIGLRVVVFGFESNARYPDAEPVPQTVLINPVIEPL